MAQLRLIADDHPPTTPLQTHTHTPSYPRASVWECVGIRSFRTWRGGKYVGQTELASATGTKQPESGFRVQSGRRLNVHVCGLPTPYPPLRRNNNGTVNPSMTQLTIWFDCELQTFPSFLQGDCRTRVMRVHLLDSLVT